MIGVVRGRGCGPLQQFTKFTHFLVTVREQVGNLRFQRACVDDFTKRRIGSQRKHVTRNVERSGPQSAVVCFLLHLRGLCFDAAQILKHLLRERFIFGKQVCYGLPVQISCLAVIAEIGRVVAALLEILVAGRAFLAIPALLVGDGDCRENRKAFNRQRNMRKVSD